LCENSEGNALYWCALGSWQASRRCDWVGFRERNNGPNGSWTLSIVNLRYFVLRQGFKLWVPSIRYDIQSVRSKTNFVYHIMEPIGLQPWTQPFSRLEPCMVRYSPCHQSEGAGRDLKRGRKMVSNFEVGHFVTALRRMQTRSSDENCVCPSVCQTPDLWQNGRKICPDFIPYERSFSIVIWEEWLMGATPFYLKFWINRPPLERNRPVRYLTSTGLWQAGITVTFGLVSCLRLSTTTRCCKDCRRLLNL